MAWIKARARDLFFFSTFAAMLFNCSYKKDDCKIAPVYGPRADEPTMPSRDELREMSCACAAGELADDCAEELWDTRDVADGAGCSNELDALLFCVEDGDACDADGAAWACGADELAWRECISSRLAVERAIPERAVTVARDVAVQRPAAR